MNVHGQVDLCSTSVAMEVPCSDIPSTDPLGAGAQLIDSLQVLCS